MSTKKKTWTGQEKLAIVLQGLRGNCRISELCNEHGITQGMFYRWRDQLLNDGAKLFAHGGVDHEVERLQRENRKLKETIGELTMELKKTTGTEAKTYEFRSKQEIVGRHPCTEVGPSELGLSSRLGIPSPTSIQGRTNQPQAYLPSDEGGSSACSEEHTSKGKPDAHKGQTTNGDSERVLGNRHDESADSVRGMALCPRRNRLGIKETPFGEPQFDQQIVRLDRHAERGGERAVPQWNPRSRMAPSSGQ